MNATDSSRQAISEDVFTDESSNTDKIALFDYLLVVPAAIRFVRWVLGWKRGPDHADFSESIENLSRWKKLHEALHQAHETAFGIKEQIESTIEGARKSWEPPSHDKQLEWDESQLTDDNWESLKNQWRALNEKVQDVVTESRHELFTETLVIAFRGESSSRDTKLELAFSGPAQNTAAYVEQNLGEKVIADFRRWPTFLLSAMSVVNQKLSFNIDLFTETPRRQTG